VDDQSPDLWEYSKFYIEYFPRLVTFLMYKGLSVADAADCVQETLIDALPPKWGTLTHPYAWCRRVAHRKASCRLKEILREVPFPESGAGDVLLSCSCVELEQLEQNHEFLHYWLRQLVSSDQREVLAWTYDGAKPAEIARELDRNPVWVRSTLRDARAALRRLRDKGDDH
jgi:DNA-directed RNA polymerase specialized sigma24 family protein